jgi:putative toxin-antitoxin system antitoxin component (TIGR02293 family)
MLAVNHNTHPNHAIWEQIGIPSRGKALHAAINKGLPYDVFVHMAQLTGIEKKELAMCLSIAPATLHRRAKAGQFSADESDKLYRFTDVLVAAVDLFEGDHNQAVKWLSSHVKGLGDNRPLDMIATSAGCDAITDMIGRLEHGVFA